MKNYFTNFAKISKELILCFCIVFFTTCIWSQDKSISEIEATGAAIDGLKLRAFESHLTCNKTTLSISTTCLEKKSLEPYCFNQTLAFLDPSGIVLNSQKYIYEERKGSEEFIFEASCREIGNQQYFLLESTKFSSCKSCEWVDVYTAFGAYLGSSSGLFDSGNLKRKSLNKSFLEKLNKNNSISSITINR